MGVPLSRQHIPALDGVRGVAILMVVAAHAGMSILRPPPETVDTLRRLSFHGIYGVDLFFVLSGYLITGILLDTRDDPGYFRTFYWRRALRIFPAYYAYLALVFCVVKPAFAATGNESWAQVDVWPYLVYLRNWLPGRGTGEPLLDHLWSLAVEEQFYLFWPALVYVVPRRRLAPVCVVLAVGALALRCALAAHGFEMEDAHRLTPARLDTLLLGALLALAIRSERWLAWCRTWMPRVGWAAVVALLILARGTNGFDAFEPLTYTAGWSLTALLSGAIVFAAATPGGGLLRRMFGWRWLRSFGRYSYAIYLLHPLITQLVSFHWLRYLKDQPAAVYWLGVLAFPPAVALGGWAMAWVSWHVLERPFLRLKDHFAYAPPVT